MSNKPMNKTTQQIKDMRALEVLKSSKEAENRVKARKNQEAIHGTTESSPQHQYFSGGSTRKSTRKMRKTKSRKSKRNNTMNKK